MRNLRSFKKLRKFELVEIYNFYQRGMARIHPKNDEFKFWQDGYHPVLLETNNFMEQKLNYIHHNPVNTMIVFNQSIMSIARQ